MTARSGYLNTTLRWRQTAVELALRPTIFRDGTPCFRRGQRHDRKISIQLRSFSIREIRRQNPNEVIDIASWTADEDFPIYPIGSKPKQLVISPQECSLDFVVPGQGYLFKQALGWQAQQMWCEVIAYELSHLVGVDVPPALVAVDGTNGQTGALIKLFYPYPEASRTTRLAHAADYMQKNFADGKKGRPHALRENLVICRLLGVEEPLRWWARALVFDTLIGNTDRHSENWGFLIEPKGENPRFSLAPLYDNGTSLGYGTSEAKLGEPWTNSRMATYIARGTHDIGWSKNEDGPTPHIALCERFFGANRDLLELAASMLPLRTGRSRRSSTGQRNLMFPSCSHLTGGGL
ncbi:HipA domain-containing protein [Mesorhizobium sp. M2A.F.Ca.ET.039.01.1.1]|uniref:HipA domain-containing protein n=1 Tax=Mesorhizobium sp. M2A.F.Ca.ET.039.01.1.1 TaxID=2496746 RepID=UPI000FCB1079|nr:HipA domain-containing protein [Mesorhizobium sp. M2A.F.Ca.ET.039.01.1.1]RWX71937.1 hypothetical protein EOA24_04050 [Mesorhizobium sp. M2A.F.Ca.ET.039.01.1.1]